METKTFTYGGYTFEPRGQFKDYGIKKGKNELRQICRAIHYPNRGYVADGDVKFNYDEFYKAAGGDCDADVFFCKETGEQYVPCSSVLCVFDKASSSDEVMERYRARIAKREEHERFVKQEALKSVMIFNEKQHDAFSDLVKAVRKCKDAGIQFVWNDGFVRCFRADLLKDLTGNMAPMEGQEQLPDGSLYYAIDGVWDACEGLYANPKEV